MTGAGAGGPTTSWCHTAGRHMSAEAGSRHTANALAHSRAAERRDRPAAKRGAMSELKRQKTADVTWGGLQRPIGRLNSAHPERFSDTTMEARDKGFATELVYGSTRMKRRLDHLVYRFLLEPPPPSARAALRIGAHQLLHLDTPPHAAVSATVAAAPKRFRGLVNAVLRKVAAVVTEGVSFPSVGTELS